MFIAGPDDTWHPPWWQRLPQWARVALWIGEVLVAPVAILAIATVGLKIYRSAGTESPALLGEGLLVLAVIAAATWWVGAVALQDADSDEARREARTSWELRRGAWLAPREGERQAPVPKQRM